MKMLKKFFNEIHICLFMSVDSRARIYTERARVRAAETLMHKPSSDENLKKIKQILNV